MLPLHSLLNPSSTDIPARHSPAAKVSSPATEGSLSRRGKIVDDASMLAKSKARGPVNYPPFEDLDEKSLAEVVKFQVTPFGQIHRSFEHIPYSSSKKDLFEKTGRESIEGLWGLRSKASARGVLMFSTRQLSSTTFGSRPMTVSSP